MLLKDYIQKATDYAPVSDGARLNMESWLLRKLLWAFNQKNLDAIQAEYEQARSIVLLQEYENPYNKMVVLTIITEMLLWVERENLRRKGEIVSIKFLLEKHKDNILENKKEN